MKIGFVGQGWIGKNYADDFEYRGYSVVRYSLDSQFIGNKEEIRTCDIVFIAVPTPTTPEGFDCSVVRDALSLVESGRIAVIKSTILPGTTEVLQAEFPEIFVMHSPEFLREASARHDASNPERNIIGIPKETEVYQDKAREVLSVLPKAPYETIMRARDAEFVKYAGNCFLYTKVMFMNILYDMTKAEGGNWDHIKDALIHDPRIGESHTEPVHSGGRGAGGHCFIKDFEAFRGMYKKSVNDKRGNLILQALAEKNIELLVKSGKDIDLLQGVYGSVEEYR